MANRWWVACWIAVAVLASHGCATRGDAEGLDLTAVTEPDDDALEGEYGISPDEASADAFASLQMSEHRCILDRGEAEGLDAFSDEPLSFDDQVAVMDILLECVTQDDVLAQLVLGPILSYLPGSAAITESDGVCVLREVKANADDAALLLASGAGEEAEVFWGALEDCLVPETFAVVGGAEGRGPFAFGDDPRLDSMQEDCEGGEMRACDLLYLASGEGTDYEAASLACGGVRSDEGGFCTPEVEIDDTGYAPEASEGLRVLGSACKDGDLTACDLLYLISAPGDPLEGVGHTCGGRVTGGAFPDCRTRLG